MPIRILFFLIACLMIVRTIDRFRRRTIHVSIFLWWLLFWGGFGTVVLFPDITSYFAQLLGVGRGVDLAIYGAMIVVFFLLFRIYVRLEGFETALTKIVRAIALQPKEREGIPEKIKEQGETHPLAPSQEGEFQSPSTSHEREGIK